MTAPAETRGRLLAPLGAAVAGVGALTLLHFRDPHVSHSYGVCPFHELTGLWCPGCGGLRAMNNLTNGDVVGSLSSNVLIVPVLLLAALAWLMWVDRLWHDRPRGKIVFTKVHGAVLAVALVGFTVLRNTPWGTWLSP
ncbi:DUF2752 domain-containing protein [Antrihabitans stalactiti]|uniref:DUF2752 domain-containing protein n=1 Tax=Antrihabitans stalactiti TaxID=2584121 RepID=A0A848KKT5_9NOCA|nr:DUF2752 domain-containing protein [Antrihabitans stalactiti]